MTTRSTVFCPGRLAAGLFLAATFVATPAMGQEPPEPPTPEEECRCLRIEDGEERSCDCQDLGEEPGLMDWAFGDDVAGALPWFVRPGRARVGITLDPEQSARWDADGARIDGLLEGGPADEAGLREGDVVVRFDGQSLLQTLGAEREEDFDLDRSLPVQRLLALARELDPGEEVEITYLRNGDERATTLEARDLARWGVRAPIMPRLEELGNRLRLRRLPEGAPDAPQVFRFRGDPGRVEVFEDGDGPHVLAFGGNGALWRCPAGGDEPGWEMLAGGCPGGLRLVALNPALGEYFRTEEGVLVADVHEDSELGLEPGDVLVRIGSRAVDSPGRVGRILSSYEPDESVTLHIVREGRAMDVQGRLGSGG